MALPVWLPELVEQAAFDGWPSYYNAVYNSYRADFIDGAPTFRGAQVALKLLPERHGRDATFHHLITRDIGKTGVEEDREICHHRCARIRYPRSFIDNHHDNSVKCWRQKKNGEWRVSILLEEINYITVLSERSGYYVLWTAYIIDENHEMRKLLRQYERAKRGGHVLEMQECAA
ncbi:hypothetical protein [Azospirillum isscasi]|uniref:Uncharacterized protein n=1 Tax=Azospirillum isscasi TaxID=3053926 RepID=A0ABU0WQC0_9PROT|nr:hypothetical protein [Azospirillum isscasi]MDQ2106438.1 hypothetical protein [Azospirillum isscasi]